MNRGGKTFYHPGQRTTLKTLLLEYGKFELKKGYD